MMKPKFGLIVAGDGYQAGREQVFEIWNFLRENFEPFKNSRILSTAMQSGAGETLRGHGFAI